MNRYPKIQKNNRRRESQLFLYSFSQFMHISYLRFLRPQNIINLLQHVVLIPYFRFLCTYLGWEKVTDHAPLNLQNVRRRSHVAICFLFQSKFYSSHSTTSFEFFDCREILSAFVNKSALDTRGSNSANSTWNTQYDSSFQNATGKVFLVAQMWSWWLFVLYLDCV